MDKKKRTYTSKEDALDKLQKYCAYQDRCHKEVRTKLLDLGIYGEDLENVMADLISEDFLNEERFARSYARGKFRMKKWGRNKIRRELKSRQISEYCIKKGMKEIEQAEYEAVLLALLTRKNEILRENSLFKRKNKLFKYAYLKGFEADLIQSFVKDLTSSE